MVAYNKVKRLNMDKWKLDDSFFRLISTKDTSSARSYGPEDEACCSECECKK